MNKYYLHNAATVLILDLYGKFKTAKEIAEYLKLNSIKKIVALLKDGDYLDVFGKHTVLFHQKAVDEAVKELQNNNQIEPSPKGINDITYEDLIENIKTTPASLL